MTTDMTDTDAMQRAGLSPLAARYYAARNAVIRNRNEKIKSAEAECQAQLAALREQYEEDRAAERAALALAGAAMAVIDGAGIPVTTDEETVRDAWNDALATLPQSATTAAGERAQDEIRAEYGSLSFVDLGTAGRSEWYRRATEYAQQLAASREA